jgi:hypothetical protein
MYADIHLATTGPDDAESLAGVLEHLAAKIRAGGGDPIHENDTVAITHISGSQDVDYDAIVQA